MKILITGGSGFVGTHLKQAFSNNDQVFIGSHKLCVKTLDDTCINCYDKQCACAKDVYFPLDDVSKMISVLLKHKFDIIYHLAAQSSVFLSFQDPLNTFELNVTGTMNLISVVSTYFSKTRIIFISSSDIYQMSDSTFVLNENQLLEAKSPYAHSKLTIDQFVRMNAEKLNLNAIIIRQFNSIGPGQKDNFVMPSFAKQIAEMKVLNKEKIIRVGNIGVYRDFIDVRDSVKAYALLKDAKVKSGEVFNICRGTAIKVKTCLEMLIQLSGLQDVKIEIDEKKFRKDDLQFVCGSNEKIKKALSWEPLIPIEQTLADMLTYWEEKVSI